MKGEVEEKKTLANQKTFINKGEEKAEEERRRGSRKGGVGRATGIERVENRMASRSS